MTNINLTTIGNVTSVGKTFELIDIMTNNAFFGMGLIAFFFIVFFSVKGTFEQKLLSSSWVCFILAVLFAVGGFVGWVYVGGFFLTAAFSYYYMGWVD